MVDGEIVGAGSEEGCWWVEGAVVEDCVDGDGEKDVRVCWRERGVVSWRGSM